MVKQQIFQRYEKKYILDGEKEKRIREILDEKMLPDMYANYTLSNIYLDTDDFYLIRTSIEHPLYKEKLRLRSYITPSPTDNVFLEIKKKYDGLGSKRRIILPQDDAMAYLLEGKKPEKFIGTQIFSEIDYAIDRYNVKPKMFIAYDRSAYKNKDGRDLRITFDSNIRYRTDNLDLSYGNEGIDLIDKKDFILMEVKAADCVPYWFAKLFEELDIKRISFSKYGNCYKKTLNKFGGI